MLCALCFALCALRDAPGLGTSLVTLSSYASGAKRNAHSAMRTADYGVSLRSSISFRVKYVHSSAMRFADSLRFAAAEWPPSVFS